MSLRRFFSGLFLGLCVVSLISISAMAQDEPTPKVELFVGYQWLHPGITVPAPFQPFNAPIGVKMGDIPEGAGASLNYNFTRFLGLEADYGVNKNDNGSVNTVSIGPRLAYRSSGTTFFIHTMMGYNRLTVPNVDTSNGIGAILGGGMDLDITRRFALRLFEADWVWANHNFSSEVSPGFADLRRP
jgi:hypothetical protein